MTSDSLLSLAALHVCLVLLLTLILPINATQCDVSWVDRHDAPSPSGVQPHFCTRARHLDCQGPPEQTALVMYMITNNDDEYSATVEWDNFAFFTRSAMVDQGESTQLFKTVDFVFTKLNPKVTKVTRCASHKNMQLLWVPPGPCDLCAHARVLQFVEAHNYDHLILMNSGVRGPFVPPTHGAHWLDAAAAAGRSKIVAKRNKMTHPTIVASPQVSWQNAFHPQSYLLSVPQRAAAYVLIPLWLKTCAGTKFACTIEGECAMGKAFHDTGVHVHSMGRNFTARNEAESRVGNYLYNRYKVPDMPNPTLWPQEPCDALFVKLGGDVWRQQIIDKGTIMKMQQLSRFMPPRNAAHTTFHELLNIEQSCHWL